MRIVPALAVSLASFVVLLAPFFAADTAHACSYAEGVFEGYPAHGATDVPTDAVLWVSGYFGVDVAPVRLVDDAGVEVASTTRAVGTDGIRVYVELVPASPLAPSATFRIVVADELAAHSPRAAIEFTTGAGPLDAPAPSTPSLDAEMVSRGGLRASCGDSLVACIASGEDVQLEATADGELARSATGELTFDTSGESLCVEVRARDAIGRFSEPVTICSDADVPLRVVPASNATSPITCAGGHALVDGVDLDELAPPASGCAVSRAREAPLVSLSALVGCVLALLGRRRTR